jgi:hypothetical protein
MVVSTLGQVSAQAPARKWWIVGPRFDAAFFLGAWLVPVLLMGIFMLSPAAAILAFALLDASHIAATLPLTLLDRTSDASTYRFYYVGIATILAGALLVSVVGGTPQVIWGSAFLFWGSYHIIRQHYGFLKLYQNRAGDMRGARAKLEVVTLYLGLAVSWSFTQALGAEAARLEGFASLPIPAWVPIALLLPLAGLLIALGLTAWRDAKAGKPSRKAPLAHLALALTNWALGAAIGIQLQSVLAMVLFITSFHDLQYHGIVWHVGSTRYAKLPEANPLASLFAPNRLFGYALALLLIGSTRQFLFGFFGVKSLFDRSTLAVMMNFAWAINFIHYLIDGRMWQMRRNPQLRKDLLLAAPRAGT